MYAINTTCYDLLLLCMLLILIVMIYNKKNIYFIPQVFIYITNMCTVNQY